MGGRMTGEDYRQLMGKTTIPQAAAFLQSHRGYRRELAGLHPEGLHREQLENALRTTYRNEYHRIFSFLSLQDQALMRFPIYQAEKEAILTSMRRLSSRHMLEPEATWAAPAPQAQHLDLQALSQAETYRQIADAARDTIYGAPPWPEAPPPNPRPPWPL